MKQFILSLTLLITCSLSAQNNAFQAGEKLAFTASYKMSGILTDLAELRLETSEIKTSKSTLLRLKGTATTYKKWDNFFKIRDLYESYVNPNTLTPYLYKREIDEGGHYKLFKYKFNYKTKTINSFRRQRSKNFASGFWDRKNKIKFTPGTNDIVTTFYKLRTLDIHKATVGATDSFNVIFDNKTTAVTFKLLGKETISTAIGDKLCYKIAIAIKDSAFNSSRNIIWLTADDNKIPVYATFKIPVGSGELRIKSATGLKH